MKSILLSLGLILLILGAAFSNAFAQNTEKNPADILRGTMKALESVSAIEYVVEANEKRPLYSYDMVKVEAKTKIIVANSPLRAFAGLQGADGATYETFALNDKIMPYSAAGAVGENNLSKAFQPLTAYTDFNLTWRLFLEREFFAKLIEGNKILYGGQDRIGDDLCDIIVHVAFNSKQNVTTTTYYWISTVTNLPRARQSLTMTKRSKSLSPQLVITVTKQNPPLTPATFAFKPTEKDSVAPPRLDEDKNSDGGDRELTNLVGKQLPDLTVNDGSLQKIKLTELINKPTLITLWATWCEPCLKEMPFFQKLVDKYDGKFQVLAIATSEEKILTAVQFAKKHPEYKFTFLLDPDAEREVSALKKSLGGVEALPTNLLINANGKIISARQGERKESEWTELIDKLITN